VKPFVLTYRLIIVCTHIVRGVITSALVLPSAPAQKRNALILNWSQVLLEKLRITVHIHGALPNPSQFPVILTSNHISWVDIFVIHCVSPMRFVSKSEVRQWPVFGWLAAKTGTLFLVRTSRRQTATIGNKMEEALMNGDSLGLFPEATTSEGYSILPFHSSMLQAAVSCQVSVLPVALRYRLHDGSNNPHIPFVGDMTFAQSLLHVLQGPPARVDVAVGDLVEPGVMNRRELARHLELLTSSLLQRSLH
jgi:1-acyl-sn-glycerol-3-phosphate acyltransferase